MDLEDLEKIWVFKTFRDVLYGYPSHVLTDHAHVVKLFRHKT